MELKTGAFLQGTEALKGTLFEEALIFLAEYNRRGALGFIINRPFRRSLHELVEFMNSVPFPLANGGPVDQEHLFFLHNAPHLIDGGSPVDKGVYYGGNFSQAVAAINTGRLTAEQIKIFVGYCGWNTGDLEAEIEEGSWRLINPDASLIFFPTS